MQRHPEVKEALREWMKVRVLNQFGGLLRSLQLTPEQIDQFVRLQTEGSWFSRAIDPDGRVYARFGLGNGMSSEEIRRQREALLGKDGLRQFYELQTQATPRTLAAVAGSDLVFSEEPLTSRQAQELLATLVANRSASREGLPFDWVAIRADATAILPHAQMGVIDHMKSQAESMQPTPPKRSLIESKEVRVKGKSHQP